MILLTYLLLHRASRPQFLTG